MERTAAYISSHSFQDRRCQEGDIGNTASSMPGHFLRTMDFDAITVAPYMGETA